VPTTQIRRTPVRLPKWNGADNTKPRRSKPHSDSDLALQCAGVETDSEATRALEIIRQRSAPAMFIMGADDKVLYANEQTLSIFKDANSIPADVSGFCHRIRTRASDASGTDCAVFRGPEDALYSFRGFLVKGQGNAPSHVMVLVDKIVERGLINSKKARENFGLSDREIDVAKLLAQGLCNKEIGAKLYVSEHTVKGHLKNITRKVGAESRGNIIAILK
jgi:DNA-binding CsgD family transcriptional regulator